MATLLEVNHLKKYFPIHRGLLHRHVDDVKAVDDVTFSIEEGEIVGLVGESGSGKSTVGRLALGLIQPTGGSVAFAGKELHTLRSGERSLFRQQAQMVFQDPYASLNPRKTILDNVGESLLYYRRVRTKEEQAHEVVKILKKVGIAPEALSRYPHQFSGGQQQRISIGRAIALSPKLIVCDEAVSALDLSVQAQILNLLYELKKTLALSYLFISHDLGVIRCICDRILVMHQGRVVESGATETVFSKPKHPYTRKLLASIPKI